MNSQNTQIYSKLTSFYAGLKQDEDDAAELRASSEALQRYAVNAGMSQEQVGVLVSAAEGALSNPIASRDDLQTRNERCLEALDAAWGNELAQNLAYAKAEAEHLAQSVPNAGEVLRIGAGSDPALVKLMADIGIARARK